MHKNIYTNIINKSPELMQVEFNELYHKECDSIFRFCFIKMLDREEALRVTQEIFSHFWQALLRNQDIKDKKVFLFKMAHRLTPHCKVKNDKSLITSTDLGKNLTERGLNLISHIAQLEKDYRYSFYLYFIENMPLEDISKITFTHSEITRININQGLKRLSGYYENA